MDGYAVLAADVAAATEDRPVRLMVIGEVPAGGVADRTVDAGTAIRIGDGAPLPAAPTRSSRRADDAPGRGRDSGRAARAGRDRPAPGRRGPCRVAAGNSIRRRGEDIREGSEGPLRGRR